MSGRARGGPTRYGGCAGCSGRRPAGARPARRPARPPSWPLRAAWIGRRRRCVAGSVDELRRVDRSCAGRRSADRSFYASSTRTRPTRRSATGERRATTFKFHVHPHLRGGVVRRKVARGSSGGGGAAPGYPLPAKFCIQNPLSAPCAAPRAASLNLGPCSCQFRFAMRPEPDVDAQ